MVWLRPLSAWGGRLPTSRRRPGIWGLDRRVFLPYPRGSRRLRLDWWRCSVLQRAQFSIGVAARSRLALLMSS